MKMTDKFRNFQAEFQHLPRMKGNELQLEYSINTIILEDKELKADDRYDVLCF